MRKTFVVLALALVACDLFGAQDVNNLSGVAGILQKCMADARAADLLCRGGQPTAGYDPPECQHIAVDTYNKCKAANGLTDAGADR